jgi:hypothetical protein
MDVTLDDGVPGPRNQRLIYPANYQIKLLPGACGRVSIATASGVARLPGVIHRQLLPMWRNPETYDSGQQTQTKGKRQASQEETSLIP